MNKNKILNINIKRLNKNAQLPIKANTTDPGFVLCSCKSHMVYTYNNIVINTGISMDIPEGYFGLIELNKEFASITKLVLKAGIVTAGDKDEIKFLLQNASDYPVEIVAKAPIAQIIILPVLNVLLNETIDPVVDATETPAIS